MALFDLSGRTALITGASSGVGFALARGLAGAGAAVILNGRRAEPLEAAAAALREAGAQVRVSRFDVSRSEEVDAAIDAIEAQGPPIDILVNNAGVQRRGALDTFDNADWRELMSINLDGVFFVARAVARHMIARRRGKIINIASVQSEIARGTTAPYAASKGAVRNLTRGMCADWARHGLQVNAIGPGFFRTPLNQALADDAKFDAWLRARTPAGRWGELDELHGAVVFLASPAADFVNGQVLYVDGGLLAVM